MFWCSRATTIPSTPGAKPAGRWPNGSRPSGKSLAIPKEFTSGVSITNW
ncbi:MAG TPA: DUF1584 domain-containing protein [Desulfotomaculum sp.]|nr:DUF1584 domain-containing protein [Desulfotomaculum sp.]